MAKEKVAKEKQNKWKGKEKERKKKKRAARKVEEIKNAKEELTGYEYGYYAKEVYTTGGGTPLPGWEIREVSYPERRWNFGMASYYHKDSRSLIIAFRGTESLWDLISDIGLWGGHPHPTQGLADELAKKAHDTGVASILLEDLFSKVVIEDEAVVAALLQQIIALIAASLVGSMVMAGGATIPGVNLIPQLIALGIAPQLAALLSSTIFSAGAGVIAYNLLISHLNKNLHVAINERESEDFVKLLRASLKEEEERSITSITFVGHSMGAYIAEMCSCRLKHSDPNTPIVVKSVTFDSPGSFDTLNGIEEYKLPNYNHMTTYLSAPNLVNTCHPHAGEVRRVYVPHVENDWTWSHFGYSLWQSAARSALYVGVPVSAFFTGGASVPLIIAGGGLVARAGGQALHIITKDRGWLIRQHSIENILSCFSAKTGLPRYYSIMGEWPYSSSLFAMGLRQAEIFLEGLRPFPDDAPGVRTIFWENHMNELQSQRLPGYRVHQDIFEDTKEVPNWTGYSFERYHESAEQGNAYAQFNLGVIYEDGRGVTKSNTTAVEWYRKAANQEYADAQFNLGRMYDYGYGIAQNDEEAIKWYQKAAAQGNVRAQDRLKQVYKNKCNTVKDTTEPSECNMYANGADVQEVSSFTSCHVVYDTNRRMSAARESISYQFFHGVVISAYFVKKTVLNDMPHWLVKSVKILRYDIQPSIPMLTNNTTGFDLMPYSHHDGNNTKHMRQGNIPFDSGVWDDNIQRHPSTGEFIFTYHVFKDGIEVGAAQFYQCRIFCRSLDMTRHNLMSVNGIFQDYDFNSELHRVNEICEALPPTYTEEFREIAKSGAYHGAIRGVANVAENTLDNVGFSKQVSRYAHHALYYGGMFAMQYLDHYQTFEFEDIPEMQKMTMSAYQAAWDTGTLVLTHTAIQQGCQFSSWIGHKAKEYGWQKTGRVFQALSHYGSYGSYAYQSYTEGPLAAGMSIGAGVIAENTVTAVGTYSVQKFLNTFGFFAINKENSCTNEASLDLHMTR